MAAAPSFRLLFRHSRESGNPRLGRQQWRWYGWTALAGVLDSGLRRNDGGGASKVVAGRGVDSRFRGNDDGVGGNDGVGWTGLAADWVRGNPPNPPFAKGGGFCGYGCLLAPTVIPAKAGIHAPAGNCGVGGWAALAGVLDSGLRRNDGGGRCWGFLLGKVWIAFAGMTIRMAAGIAGWAAALAVSDGLGGQAAVHPELVAG